MKKFIKNWTLLTVSSFIQQALGFFILVKIARVLEPSGYGVYTIILTTVGIGQVLSSLGLRQIIIREIARFEDTVKIVAKKTFFLTLSAFVGTSLLLIIYLYFFENLKDSLILVFATFLLLSQIIWNITEAFSFGKQEMQYSSFIGLISTIFWFLAIIIAPAAFLNLNTILTIYVLIQFGRALLFILMEWKNKYFAQIVSPSKIISYKELIAQSLPLYGSSLLTIPITQLPILFLGNFSGKAEVGYYGIGNRLIVPVGIVSAHLLNAIYPVFAKDFVHDKESFYRNGRRFFLAIFFIGLFLTTGISFFGKEIVSVLFGLRYENAIKPFSIQVLTSLNFTMHAFLGTIFLATNKEKLMIKLSIFSAITIGIANFFGSKYGAEGLALSSFYILIFSFAFHWYFVKKHKLIQINSTVISIFVTVYLIMSALSIYAFGIHIAWKILIFSIFFSFVLIYVIRNWGETIRVILGRIDFLGFH